MTDFYDNLLKATNNVDDITTEKYGVITKLDGIYCSVKETDNDLEHNNVPIINGANLSVGDKVIIGFLNNSIYAVVCYGALDKTVHDDSKQDLLVSGTNIKTINHQSLLGSGNITIEGGGTGVDIVTSWSNPTTDTSVPSKKLTKDTLDLKLDSSDAFSGDYEDLNNKPTIPSKITDLTNDSNFIEKSSTNGLVKNDGTIDTTNYSTFDGNYNDLSNKPSIPTAISDLTNDSDFIETSSTTGLIKNDGSIDTNTYLTQHQDVSTWTSQTIATYGTLYVNTALRLCEFRYYRTGYAFSSTAQVTLHSAVIPSTYRPKYTYYLASWDNQVSIAVGTEGNIIAYTSSKGTRNIVATGMWHY